MRLGTAEFQTPQATRDEARALFIRALRDVAPDVIVALRDEVFIHYKPNTEKEWQAWARGPRHEDDAEIPPPPPVLGAEPGAPLPVAVDGPPLLPPEPAGTALETWAQRYQLTDAWLMNWATSVLRWWCAFPGAATRPVPLLWYPHAEAPVGMEPLPAVLNWDPERESRPEVAKRLHKVVERHLDYREQQAVAAGRMRVPTKRHRNVPPEQHFAWAVLHRVANLSPGRMLQDDAYRGLPVGLTNVNRRIREVEILVT